MFQPLVILAAALVAQAQTGRDADAGAGAPGTPSPSSSAQVRERSFRVDSAHSSLRYFVVHTLHKVNGESKKVEGKLVFRPDGKALVMVRAPVASFTSGEGNRDEHMQETLDAARFSHVTFKASTAAVPPTSPGTQPLSLAGELEFHGEKQRVTVPLEVELAPGGGLRVRGAFSVSLDRFRVDRPSLLLVKIEDDCRIEFDLVLEEESR